MTVADLDLDRLHGSGELPSLPTAGSEPAVSSLRMQSTPITAKPTMAAAVTSSAVVIREGPRSGQPSDREHDDDQHDRPITSCQNGSEEAEQRFRGERRGAGRERHP